jgi:tRNA-specific 2-thiouridylase
MSNKGKRVVLGMSGGLDSSLAAYLLKEQGYEVIGVHNQYWVDPHRSSCSTRTSNKCCSNEGITIARKIAQHLSIPFYVFDVAEVFKEKVVNYFIKSYEAGITPNPCVMCNKYIKFGIFLEKALALGADYIATGHYARIDHDPISQTYTLHTGKDIKKDQSYFLYRLDQAQLSRILFPLGNFTKEESRALAKSSGLPFPEGKKESQGICFFPEKEQTGFLDRYVTGQHPGEIIDHLGTILGTHKGLAYYTFGQREGLDLGGLPEPYYVIKKDPETNHLVVGPREYLFSDTLLLTDPHFISGTLPTFPFSAFGKIRYHANAIPLTLTQRADGKILAQFTEKVRSLTPGQSLVFHEGEKVLGGAIIQEPEKTIAYT